MMDEVGSYEMDLWRAYYEIKNDKNEEDDNNKADSSVLLSPEMWLKKQQVA